MSDAQMGAKGKGEPALKHEKMRSYMHTLQFFDDNIDDYIYMYDMAQQRVYFTDKIRKKFPLPPAKDGANDFADWEKLVFSKDCELMNHYRSLLQKGEIQSFDISYRIFDKKGEKVWVNVKGAVRRSEPGQSPLLVGRVADMAQSRMVDRLTGLRSIDKFMEDMHECIKDNHGYLMILGVDNFKNVNITQGRSVGDDILKSVADVLEKYTEYSMGLYRLDGDCFAVIFPNRTQDQVTQLYSAVQKELQDVCTLSAGVVGYKKEEAADSGVVYQYAENALDKAKKEGKNQLVFFSSADYQKNLEQVELLDEMRSAVQKDCNGFSLCYQPQIKSQDFAIYGVEALLRYDSPTKGRVSPVEFIPLLEESELICPVGEWVLKSAIEQCKEWRQQIPDFHISVNMSYVQLKQPEIADVVLNLLKEAGLPGDALTLEVTESIQLQDYRYFNKIFYTWKEYGVKVSIDDFGTGYSSLGYLKSIEIDEVKIDRCFVERIQYNAYNYRLLSNMIELAHSARIQVCCEGVETVEELLTLQQLHADLQQGYLFAKPLTKEQLEQVYICRDSQEYQARKAKEAEFYKAQSVESRELLEGLRKEEIGNIVEGMDEIVYVSDVENYDLYYMNAEGRRRTGVYDYKGCKCYKVLQGRDEPCEFCTNMQLQEDKFHVWEAENKFLGRHYILKDKLIPWQGKIARLEIAIDITEKEIVSKAIQKKLDLEEAIIECCRILAGETDADKSANQVVKIMGEFCRGDRAYILKPNQDTGLWDISWEWCAQGVASAQNRFPVRFEKLKDTDQQMICAPILRKNKMIGLVRVDTPRCGQEGSDLIEMMAHFLGHSMIGEQAQEKLDKLLESRYEDILNHTGLGLWVIRIDPKTGEKKLYPDQVMCRIMAMERTLTPQESYHHWYSRIDPDYYDYVNQKVQRMIETWQITHLEYPWHAPSGVEMNVRCVGVRREDRDGMIRLEGYHWMIDA